MEGSEDDLRYQFSISLVWDGFSPPFATWATSLQRFCVSLPISTHKSTQIRHSQSLRISQQVLLPTKPCAHPHSFCPFCFLLGFSSFPSGLIRCELFSVCEMRWRFSFTICWRDDGSSVGYFWPWTVVPWVYFWLFHCFGLSMDLCASTRPSYLQTWKQELWGLQLCPAPKDCLWLFGGLIWFPMSFAYWLFFFS